MNTTTTKAMVALAAPLATGIGDVPGLPPEAAITNQFIRVKLFLPDATTGFYRGTRFDWSGVVGSLEFAGHEFYPRWFHRTDPAVHDYVYDGPDIVAGPCTAVTGPAEEFSTEGQGLGFAEAAPGGTFIKIGVGVLRRPDDKRYDPYHLYPIVDGGRWTVTQRPDAIEFHQTLSDPATGYGYDYRKTVSLVTGKPAMVLDHALRNTGKRAIASSVYNHNFLFLDRQPPSPTVTITLPFELRTSTAATPGLAELRGNRIEFQRTFADKDQVYLDLRGFGGEARDHDIRIEHRGVGAGLRIQSDRPLSRLALWTIRAPLSVEPFIAMQIEPGTEFTWQTRYEYFTLPRGTQ